MIKSTFCTIPLRSFVQLPKYGKCIKVNPRQVMTEEGHLVKLKDAELVTKVK